MDAYETEAHDGALEARRTTLYSLYARAPIREVEADVAAMKAELFQRDMDATRAQGSALLNPLISWKHQCRVLLNQGYAEEMKVTHADFTLKLAILAHAAEKSTTPSPYHFPCLIAVPHACVRISKQLARINTQQFLRDEDFSTASALTVPSLPYLITDVSLGFELRNVCAEDARSLLSKQGRFPLTLEEIAVLVLQTSTDFSTILDYTFPAAAGTRHCENFVPDLYHAGHEPASGKSVKLKRETTHYVYAPAWSIPSCKQRVVA